ncbi:MAG: hypothetical protein MHM6MM_001796 [Cercozoa sp. M6MM]
MEAETVVPRIGRKSELEHCLTLIEHLRTRPEAQPFADPVDAEALGIPHYHEVIQVPMDLATIKSKLQQGAYDNAWQVAEDVRLCCGNAVQALSYVHPCLSPPFTPVYPSLPAFTTAIPPFYSPCQMVFNAPGSPVYQMAIQLATTFTALFDRIPKAKAPAHWTRFDLQDAHSHSPAMLMSATSELVRHHLKSLRNAIRKLNTAQLTTLIEITEAFCPHALSYTPPSEDSEDSEALVDVELAELLPHEAAFLQRQAQRLLKQGSVPWKSLKLEWKTRSAAQDDE